MAAALARRMRAHIRHPVVSALAPERGQGALAAQAHPSSQIEDRQRSLRWAQPPFAPAHTIGSVSRISTPCGGELPGQVRIAISSVRSASPPLEVGTLVDHHVDSDRGVLTARNRLSTCGLARRSWGPKSSRRAEPHNARYVGHDEFRHRFAVERQQAPRIVEQHLAIDGQRDRTRVTHEHRDDPAIPPAA